MSIIHRILDTNPRAFFHGRLTFIHRAEPDAKQTATKIFLLSYLRGRRTQAAIGDLRRRCEMHPLARPLSSLNMRHFYLPRVSMSRTGGAGAADVDPCVAPGNPSNASIAGRRARYCNWCGCLEWRSAFVGEIIITRTERRDRKNCCF